MKNDKTKVKRIPKRGFYDKETIYRILDNDFVCQMAFVYNNYPVIIPTIYGRKDDCLYFHGASVSRMLLTLEKGVQISLNVTKTKGLVLARSAFHHSLNYDSVTIFGCATLVENDKDKLEALKIITNQIIPERWEEVRLPNKKELNVTKVLQLKITEASAKIRDEGVGDDKEDYALDIWAGIIPITQSYGKPVADKLLKEGIDIPKSVKNILI
ncbi:MAG: pyridoxamine 5'-phosphate oxidase family protein [Flavobacteriaceae bacterium]|nr:pyridoxamine 5'-phosphate oxidase family protein [Flavobacteriaceae bacterium]